jgi:hypothetical protein
LLSIHHIDVVLLQQVPLSQHTSYDFVRFHDTIAIISGGSSSFRTG